MAIAVTTRGYNNARTGSNAQETVLTADAVATNGIRRLFSLPLPGDKRGAEAQPLVVPGVRLPDGSTREVIYVATMANWIYAFDAQTGSQLWQKSLGTPIKSTPDIDSHPINDNWGILSTPVIEPGTGTMYAVAWISPDGTVAKAQHYLCAIRITDGSLMGQVNLEKNATYDPGHGLPQLQFRSAARKQRASLLLTSIGGASTVFIGFGSLKETLAASRGWIIACGTNPLAVTAAWASTARGHGGGIWQAGAGLAADGAGFIYAMTGNGNFDAATDWGESFVKLSYTRSQDGAPASLRVVDWWTPFSDQIRWPTPSNRGDAPTNKRAYIATSDWADMDVGSGGPVLIESQQVLVGAGKDGILYVLDSNGMGKTKPADLAKGVASKGNYGKLKSSAIFFTYYPPGWNPTPEDITSLNQWYAKLTHHQHGSPIYWKSPDTDRGPVLYCWGENGNLRAWSLQPSATVQYLACGAEQASAQSPATDTVHGGMPGGMLTVSANGNQPNTGVVWALIPYLDANTMVSPGRLLAYDATRFGTYADNSKQLRVLWDSERWNLPFSFNKFNVPVVANGRLIVPTYDGRVDVYGL